MNIVEKYLWAKEDQMLDIKLKLVRLQGSKIVKAGNNNSDSLIEITFYHDGQEVDRYVSEAKVGLSGVISNLVLFFNESLKETQ